MTIAWSSRRASYASGVVLGIRLLLSSSASAGPIGFDQWLQFAFTDPGVSVTGCVPDDPAGGFCIPSSGTLTTFLDAPPWTFALVGTATLKVTDAFTSGDQFEILNFGVPFAMTSLPVAGADCGDDPVPCFADASMSTLGVALAAGNYSLTFAPLAAPTGGGSAYFIVETAVVPEPAVVLLLGGGVVLALGRRNAYRSARRRVR